MSIQVIVHISSPNGIHQAAIETFSRVPNVGEKIEVPEGTYQVIDVTHCSFRGLPADAPVAKILVQQ
jgi:hypothetical protein